MILQFKVFCDAQVSVEYCPLFTVEGVAVKEEIVGAGVGVTTWGVTGGATTVRVADLVTLPPEPVHVRV